MKTVINGKLHFVGWRYDNPALVSLLDEAGIPLESARTMKPSERNHALGIAQAPLPTQVWCTVSDEQGEIIAEASVKRRRRKSYSKEDMRKGSLGRVLQGMYPGYENKPTRKAYWDAYFSRKNLNNGISNAQPAEATTGQVVEAESK